MSNPQPLQYRASLEIGVAQFGQVMGALGIVYGTNGMVKSQGLNNTLVDTASPVPAPLPDGPLASPHQL